jgi:transposase
MIRHMQDVLTMPEDVDSCQRLLRELWARQTELAETCTTLQGQEEKLRQENEELQATVQHLLRQLYGRRSERCVEGQGQQHFEFDSEASDPSILSAANEDPIIEEVLIKRRKHRKRRSEKLPEHLERRTERIEPTLPAGIRREDCALIGLDVVEVSEFQRGKLWVRRIEYPKYKVPAATASPEVTPVPENGSHPTVLTGAVEMDSPMATEPIPSGECRREAFSDARAVSPADGTPDQRLLPQTSAAPADPWNSPAACVVPRVISSGAVVNSHGIIQAPRLVTLVEGGNFGFSIAAQVLFEKFGLHVPLYRQQDSLAQLGWSPHRSTLGLIVQNAAELFVPLADRFRRRVLATEILGTDDTWVTLLTPGDGDGSRKARFWLYRGRQQAPYDVFAFTDSRERDGPDNFLASFRGILSGDCYSGYVNIAKVTAGRIKFSACLGHARRYVFNARAQQPVLGSQLMAQFRQLYDIEDRARTMDDAARLALRQQESVPVMKRLRELLDGELAKRVLPRTKFGEALGYLRNHWEAFQVYLQDGRVPIDNNDVERDLRRVAVGRKNWLFVGSLAAGERAATILSIIASAHRHDLDVWEYLCDALDKLAHGRAVAGGDVSQIDPVILESLLPDVWAQTHPESIRTFRTEEKEQRAATRRLQRAQRRRTRSPD